MERGEKKLISHVAYEGAVFSDLPFCFQEFQELRCSAPVVVALTRFPSLDRKGFW